MYSEWADITEEPLRAAASVGLRSIVELPHSVQAGFPSPAEDHAVKRIDLNEVLI